jgi:hypothetical protein
MRRFFLASLTLVAGTAYVGVFHVADETPASREQAASTIAPTTADANRLMQGQPGFFVPNLGQWDHAARFVHRSGPMTLFLEDRGWVIDLVERPTKHKTNPHEAGLSAMHPAMPGEGEADQKIRGVALQMTFEGDGHVPKIVGEKKLSGHHNYFLGNDENRWRTHVPLYGSVRYENLYPGIDLRLREANGVPEYDLLLQAGADLSLVNVHVEGAKALSIAKDGSLVIDTALGPLTQSMPKTWEVGRDGRKREVVCNFTLLGTDWFGFATTGWDGDTSLTIDPGLIWSTLLGGNSSERAEAISVDAFGVVTVAGSTAATDFPTKNGAYTTSSGGTDSFVSRLLPLPVGRGGLIYSTYLGGRSNDYAYAMSVDANGVVTVAGYIGSINFPTTRGAYDTTHNGGSDVFVSRFDPRKTGAAQLIYSTFLGGTSYDFAWALAVDASGVVTVAGQTDADFPTTRGAYDTTHNGGWDVFVSRLDPRKTGSAQLVYSTFLGGSGARRLDVAQALAVDAKGVATVAGWTSSTDFPTTSRAYDTRHNNVYDAFISRLDPSKVGSAQLVYSTFLGGPGQDRLWAMAVDGSGVVTVAGDTWADFPTTSGAYDRDLNGANDVFVSRLDFRKAGAAQLVYSTLLGGGSYDGASTVAVDTSGVVTVAGFTSSANLPTTRGAYDTTQNNGVDAFVSRLDPSKTGTAQLVYSTYLGGLNDDFARALAVDASGVVTVAGYTGSIDFPTTRGAFDTTLNVYDAFISRLDMGVALYGNVHHFSKVIGGTQTLTVNAGKAHANRLYWIFGSVTGTTPGVNLLGVHVPLNPDLYTDVAMGAVNTTVFAKFRGTLDGNGLATASFRVPSNLPLPAGFTFHHAYVVYDASGKFYMASNAVPLRMR